MALIVLLSALNMVLTLVAPIDKLASFSFIILLQGGLSFLGSAYGPHFFINKFNKGEVSFVAINLYALLVSLLAVPLGCLAVLVVYVSALSYSYSFFLRMKNFPAKALFLEVLPRTLVLIFVVFFTMELKHYLILVFVCFASFLNLALYKIFSITSPQIYLNDQLSFAGQNLTKLNEGYLVPLIFTPSALAIWLKSVVVMRVFEQLYNIAFRTKEKSIKENEQFRAMFAFRSAWLAFFYMLLALSGIVLIKTTYAGDFYLEALSSISIYIVLLYGIFKSLELALGFPGLEMRLIYGAASNGFFNKAMFTYSLVVVPFSAAIYLSSDMQGSSNHLLIPVSILGSLLLYKLILAFLLHRLKHEN